MRFGPVPPQEAKGAILAHSHKIGRVTFKKGRVLSGDDVAVLVAAGAQSVTVARLEEGDVGEDAAATRLARALVPDPAAAHLRLTKATTGRVNLNAVGPGIVSVDADAVLRLNSILPEITLATLSPQTRVGKGLLVGTVKIISYAVPEAALVAACEAARGAVSVRPVVLRDAALIMTEVEGQKPSLNEKGREAMEGRLRALGMSLSQVVVVPHKTDAIAAALTDVRADLALILTGSATSDIHDTAPQAVRAAGGVVHRFGMPVDPGNLLFIGEHGGRPVIGLPGCARSPALNGADFVLEQVVCGAAPSGADIAAMGVGGLLKEIPSRPRPREG